jgi:hypothetical protein
MRRAPSHFEAARMITLTRVDQAQELGAVLSSGHSTHLVRRIRRCARVGPDRQRGPGEVESLHHGRRSARGLDTTATR